MLVYQISGLTHEWRFPQFLWLQVIYKKQDELRCSDRYMAIVENHSSRPSCMVFCCTESDPYSAISSSCWEGFLAACHHVWRLTVRCFRGLHWGSINASRQRSLVYLWVYRSSPPSFKRADRVSFFSKRMFDFKFGVKSFVSSIYQFTGLHAFNFLKVSRIHCCFCDDVMNKMLFAWRCFEQWHVLAIFLLFTSTKFQ